MAGLLAQMANEKRTPADNKRSVSHLVSTVLYNLAHAKSHTEDTRTKDKFNQSHALGHLQDAIDHGEKLAALVNTVPGIGRETKRLAETTDKGQARI